MPPRTLYRVIGEGYSRDYGRQDLPHRSRSPFRYFLCATESSSKLPNKRSHLRESEEPPFINLFISECPPPSLSFSLRWYILFILCIHSSHLPSVICLSIMDSFMR